MNLLIRADASEQIGSGHVMRMIALGQAWMQRGGQVNFVVRTCPPSLTSRLAAESFAVRRLDESLDQQAELQWMSDFIGESQPSCVVFDGYGFDSDYQRKIFAECQGKRPMLVVDDYRHLPIYHGDLILNQNLGAVASDYGSVAPAIRVLAGTNFTLIRRELLSDSNWQRDSRRAKNLLITLGGADPANATALVLHALSHVADLKLLVRVLVGNNNVRLESLQHIADQRDNVIVLPHVDDMATQYRWADLAIAAGGSTNWEMCQFGLPRLLIVLAENQIRVAAALDQVGAATSLGPLQTLDEKIIANAIRQLATDEALRTSQCTQSRQLIDGRGAERVVDEIVRIRLLTGTSNIESMI